MHEDAFRGELGFDLFLHEAGIVGRILEDLAFGHDRVGGEVDEDRDRLIGQIVESNHGELRVGGLRLALGVTVSVQGDRFDRDAELGGLQPLVGLENGVDQQMGQLLRVFDGDVELSFAESRLVGQLDDGAVVSVAAGDQYVAECRLWRRSPGG